MGHIAGNGKARVRGFGDRVHPCGGREARLRGHCLLGVDLQWFAAAVQRRLPRAAGQVANASAGDQAQGSRVCASARRGT